ncbi:MAG: hypothetical protein P8J27_05590 [Mariniblastus sp.]|nr:hypothetical protein [Mariniblastus sp.]
MSATPSSTHTQERIALLTKELASKRRSTNWGSNLTLIVGMIAILLLCGYFGYGYYMFNDITNPKTIVASAKSYVEDLSIEARKTAGEEVRKSAPIWAKQASLELVANMPEIRKKAETTLQQYFDEQLSRTKDLTRSEFAKIVQANREDFEEAINIIVEENKSDEFVAKVMPIIEQQYATDMKGQINDVLGGLQFINGQLDTLAAGKDLNPIQQKQRYILGLTRLVRQ